MQGGPFFGNSENQLVQQKQGIFKGVRAVCVLCVTCVPCDPCVPCVCICVCSQDKGKCGQGEENRALSLQKAPEDTRHCKETCKSSPPPGATRRTDKSHMVSTMTSDWPTPTVSIRITSYPAAVYRTQDHEILRQQKSVKNSGEETTLSTNWCQSMEKIEREGGREWYSDKVHGQSGTFAHKNHLESSLRHPPKVATSWTWTYKSVGFI